MGVNFGPDPNLKLVAFYCLSQVIRDVFVVHKHSSHTLLLICLLICNPCYKLVLIVV